MKTSIRFIFKGFYALAILPLLFACQRLEEPGLNNIPERSDAKVFYGEVPLADSATKTFLDSEASMFWANGDKISLFRSSVNEQYHNTGDDGSTHAVFQKNDEMVPGAAFGHNYAFYPWSASVSSDVEGTIGVTLPDTQPYAAHSFSPGMNPMVAVTEDIADDNLQFQNVCGYLVLRLYGTATVRRIRFRGNNNEVLCGTATVSASYGVPPVVALDSEGGKLLTLDCGESGVAIGADKENMTPFWLVVPPISFTKGFTIEIEGTCGTVTTRSTDKSVSITQGHAQPMAAFEVNQNGIDMLSFSLTKGVNTYRAFNISNGYVNIVVPNGTDLTDMVASFNYSGASIAVNDVPQSSGADSHDFSDFTNRVEYVITGVLGDTQTYTIRLFDLPVVMLETPSPITSKEIWTEGCSMKIYEGNGTVTDYKSDVQVRGRGNTTWEYPKKPYAIKLDKKAEVLGMPKHKRWVLLANWMDRTLLRNAFAFQIAKQTDLAWTPSGEFVEVLMNGEHLGNYYLCEQVKVDKNRLNIKEMKTTDISGDSVTGGYLMEVDGHYDEVNKFRPTISNLPFMFKDPDEDVLQPEQLAYMQSYVNDMEAALYADDWAFTRAYTFYLDMDSFIDYWFVFELAMNHEPLNPKSVYFHKDRLGKLKAGPVWDFDWATFIPSRTQSFQITNALYYGRLLDDPMFRYVVKNRWAVLKPAFDLVPDYIESLAETLRSSNAVNLAMWPLSEHPYGSINGDGTTSYDEAISRIVTSYKAKLSWMDNQISHMTCLPPEYPVTDGSDYNPTYGSGWGDENW